MQRSREKQQRSYWHEADSEPGIILEMPDAAEEKPHGKENYGRTQSERSNWPETDQIESGANRGCNQDQVEQRAVGVREAEHFPPDGVIEQRGPTESDQAFEQNPKREPGGE